MAFQKGNQYIFSLLHPHLYGERTSNLTKGGTSNLKVYQRADLSLPSSGSCGSGFAPCRVVGPSQRACLGRPG